MKKVAVLTKVLDLPFYFEEGMDEIILPVFGFSRFPLFKKEELEDVLLQIKKEKKRAILEWDFLYTEYRFEEMLETFDIQFLSQFSALRMMDLGLYEYLKNYLKDKELHLILEHGNHNLESLKTFDDDYSNLKRLILSLQIPKEKILFYKENLKLDLEILADGPIVLSSSARKLLSRHGENFYHARNLEGGEFEVLVFEKEDQTLLYDMKRFYIPFEEWENFSYLRFDPRLKEKNVGQTHGFFYKNNSSEVFSMLKNHLIEREDGLYAGDVVDVIKGEIMGIHYVHPTYKLKVGDELIFKTPEGKIKEEKVEFIKDFIGRQKDEAHNGEIIFLKHKGTVSVRSSVYFKGNE